MKIGKLVRDPTLLPALPKKASVVQTADHKARREFLLQRARAALVANPTWKGTDPDEVKAANTAALKTLLRTEVGAAATKVATLRTTMANTAQTELLGIDVASIDPPRAAAGRRARFAKTYGELFGRGPLQLRATGIVAAAWMHVAEDPALSDADLHSLVSRRLMVAERMLWYIGKVGDRGWGKTTANKWDGTDGWERMFEYPRLPVMRPLIATCNLSGSNTTCDAAGGLAGWEKETRYTRDHKVVDGATALWKRDPTDSYGWFFNKTAGNDPADAVTKLFTAHKDFRKRNLLYCDQAIQCCHLEALVRVKSKRDGNTTWFRTLVNAEPDGWVRIIHPNKYDPSAAGPKYLVGKFESRFFELREVEVANLAIGDHLIVYNHPAYDRCKDPDDVWRLENAVVVALSPRLLLQGHGTYPIPFSSTIKPPVKGEKRKIEASMRFNMLGLFNAKLNELRALAKAENAKTTPAITLSLPGGNAVLVQRMVAGPHSGYAVGDFTAAMAPLARWWIRWSYHSEKNEAAIAADSAWAKWIWDTQRIEFAGGSVYFPLWLPRLDRNKAPVRKGGKISKIDPVWVSQSMAPGWNWYYEKNEATGGPHRTRVRRPEVS